MSSNTKHILISVLFAAIAQVLQGLVQIIPASLQPVITAGVAYFTHYVLENPSTPASTPSLPAPTAAAPASANSPGAPAA